MFGVRLNQVFASRWKALLWAAGVLMTAYCAVPSPEDTKAEQDLAKIEIPLNPAPLPGPGFED